MGTQIRRLCPENRRSTGDAPAGLPEHQASREVSVWGKRQITATAFIYDDDIPHTET